MGLFALTCASHALANIVHVGREARLQGVGIFELTEDVLGARAAVREVDESVTAMPDVGGKDLETLFLQNEIF